MVEISVIIPIYNCEDFLEETLTGISNQTFKDLEVICVDDCSTDHSLEILEEYAKKDTRFKVYHLEENRGGGYARNFAMEKLSGKYLYCMDADDVIMPTALEELYELIEEKNVDFVTFPALELDEYKQKLVRNKYFLMESLSKVVGDQIFDFRDLEEELVFDFCVTPWNKLCNMEFIRKSGAKFAEGTIFHDNPFFYEMLFNSKSIYFYNKVLYHKRKHPQSIHGVRGKKYFDTFIIHNSIQNLFIKYDLFDRYKPHFYNKKIRVMNNRYNQIDDSLKEPFFEELKKDFSKIIEEEGEEINDLVNERNQEILKNSQLANSRFEYSLYMERYDFNEKINQLKDKNKKLNQENKSLKKKNKTLEKNNKTLKTRNEKMKKQNLELREKNQMILSSNSWKLTKPLRNIKRVVK